MTSSQSPAGVPLVYAVNNSLNGSKGSLGPAEKGTLVRNKPTAGQRACNCFKRMLMDISAYKAPIVVVLIPLLALPLALEGSREMRCAYCVVIMGAYWMFEVMPLAITACMPAVLFPLLGVLSSSQTCSNFLKDIVFLFIGGLIIALAVEKCNLHQRIALRVLTLVGSQPKWLMLGFMSVTAFLSMWISNTATCAMMVPIAQSVILQLVGGEPPPAAGGRTSSVRRQKTSEVRRSRSHSPTKQLDRRSSERDDIALTMARHEISEERTKSPNAALGALHEVEDTANHFDEFDGLDLDRQVEEGNDAEPAALPQRPGSRLSQRKAFEDAREKAKRQRQAGARRKSSVVEYRPQAAQKQKEIGLDINTLSPEDASMAKGLLLAIAFAANIGGTGTITGTPPNLVIVSKFDEKFPVNAGLISYLWWMQFAIPLMVLAVIVCWFIMCVMFLGIKKLFKAKAKFGPEAEAAKSVEAMMLQKYTSLPPMSYAERSVMVLFALLLIMWITRDPKVVPGFGQFFLVDKKGKSYFSDATSAMIISVLLFILPDQMPDWLCLRPNRAGPPKLRGSLMDWNTMQHKFPWSVVLLLGGGFALAAGVDESGLSKMVGEVLRNLDHLDKWQLQLICILATICITNICSNTVTAVIFLQIVAEMAQKLEYHPMSFMLPTVLSCSYAFLLPVATPPNAIVFASGMLHVTDMLKSGLVITVVSVFMILIYMMTYAQLLLPLGQFPWWANATVNEMFLVAQAEGRTIAMPTTTQMPDSAVLI